MFRRNMEEIRLESMRAHLDFFAALETRHMTWMQDTRDPEIEHTHLEIIALIQETREKYAFLLDKYYQNHS
jgi:hypothetical protein